MEILKFDTIYVVSSVTPDHTPALTKAKGKSEYCITASPYPEKVSFENWYTNQIKPEHLLKSLPENVGIFFVLDHDGIYYSANDIKKFNLGYFQNN